MRPEGAFTRAIAWREKAAETLSPSEAQAELRNVNALYSLLDNRYQRKVGYYCSLITESEGADMNA